MLRPNGKKMNIPCTRLTFQRGTTNLSLIFYFHEFGHDIDDGFIVFANGYGPHGSGMPYTGKKNQRLHNHPNDFGFDLIIIDEASQLPTNYLMAALQMVRPFTSTVNAPDSVNASTLNELTLENP